MDRISHLAGDGSRSRSDGRSHTAGRVAQARPAMPAWQAPRGRRAGPGTYAKRTRQHGEAPHRQSGEAVWGPQIAYRPKASRKPRRTPEARVRRGSVASTHKDG